MEEVDRLVLTFKAGKKVFSSTLIKKNGILNCFDWSKRCFNTTATHTTRANFTLIFDFEIRGEFKIIDLLAVTLGRKQSLNTKFSPH